MSNFESNQIINIALVGHASTGKTILSDAILCSSGLINKVGSIEGGTTTSDYNDYEKDSQHSMSLSLFHIENEGKKINFIDAPGYLDFQGEMKSALRVADNALIVVNSCSGVEMGTELSNEYACNELKKPRSFVINMVDNAQSNFEDSLNQLQSRFGRSVFPFLIPVAEGEDFVQVADVLRKKILTYKDRGAYDESLCEGDLKDRIDKLYEELIELIAESDEKLLDQYFENGELTQEEMRGGLSKAILDGSVSPTFCASGLKNVGISRIIDIITKYFPSSDNFIEVKGTKPNSEEEILIKCNKNEPLSALVFKTMSAQHVGELSFFRVYSGSVKSGDDIYNSSRNESEKLRQIFTMNGQNKKEASKLVSGDIGTVLKLKNTHTNDTMCNSSSPVVLSKISFPNSIMSFAIHPESRGEEEKIATGLSLMHEEDPTFKYRVDPELKQTIISGQGELHLDMVINRISSRFGVNILKEAPKIPYRETITSNAEAKYRHKKQSGGSGQFAEVWMRIAPSERGSGIDFSQSLSGQNVDRGFVPSVEKGVNGACSDGIISGSMVVDVKIDFYDGKMHPVDSNDMAFQIAGKAAFVDAFKNARPKLLEPIYKIKVKVPDEMMGDVMGDISSRRGKVGGMDADGHFQIINAEVPQVNLHDYATALKSMTSGRGIFSIAFSHYEDMPANEAQKVISEYEAARQQGN